MLRSDFHKYTCRKTSLCLGVLLALLTSCASIMGVRNNATWLDNEVLKSQFATYQIPAKNQFLLNDTSYTAAIKKTVFNSNKLDSQEVVLKKAIAKDNLQPLQIRYFDNNGNQIFRLVNCYVPPSSNWNVDGCFDVFPPSLRHQKDNQLEHKLDFFLNHITDLDGNKLSKADLPASNYYALVFWNDIFYKMSYSMIQTINQYNQLHSKKGIFTFYVNNHNSTIQLIKEVK